MKINVLEKFLGSGFYTGYIPLASGTFGSLAALIIYYIPNFEKLQIIIPVIIIFTVLGVYLGSKFENMYGKDPAECTIDEIVGMWISLLFLPKTWIVSTISFFVWRTLDIIKPFPARKAEALKGGLGIMMDDLISAVYSLIIVHIILVIFGKYIIN
ncbi:MAG: phosphatidylglycerophosphatase A [Ignavibacteriaceae bacterium]|nr:phosphatidylglycerophosphatase A [Ignavibacteriaceae bacterium]